MAEVSWTHQALDDLEAICLFISRDAPHYASLFADQAFRAADRLAKHLRFDVLVPESDMGALSREKLPPDPCKELLLLAYSGGVASRVDRRKCCATSALVIGNIGYGSKKHNAASCIMLKNLLRLN